MSKDIYKYLLNIILMFFVIFSLSACNQVEKTPEEKRQETNATLKENVNMEILDSIITKDKDGYIKNCYKIKITNNNKQPIKFWFSGIKIYDRANVKLRDMWNVNYNIEPYGLEKVVYMDSNTDGNFIVSFSGLDEYKNEIQKTEIEYTVSELDTIKPVIFEGLEIKNVILQEDGIVTYTVKNNTEYAIEKFCVSLDYYNDNNKIGQGISNYNYFYTSNESFYPGEEKNMSLGSNYIYKDGIDVLPNEFNEFEYLPLEKIKNSKVKGNLIFAIIDKNKTDKYNNANNK